MSKKSENIKITAAVPPKVDILMRRQAFDERITLGEMLERYQNAYLEKLEREKAERKAEKTEEKKSN